MMLMLLNWLWEDLLIFFVPSLRDMMRLASNTSAMGRLKFTLYL